jgi:hypothetical protein
MIKEKDGYNWQPQPNEPVFKTEEQLQNHCYKWFHNSFPAWRKMLFHVDNNSWNAVIGAKKKALGVNAGVSDMIFISFVETLFLECKLPGETQSQEQIEFQQKVEERGKKYLLFKYFSHFQYIVMEAIISR